MTFESSPTATATAAVHEFLNPESMMTPGLAGALTMMITNALALNFGAHRAWTGLMVSGLFGLVVLASNRGFFLKVLYYVINSLIIFCVASGVNGFGSQATSAGIAAKASSFLISPALGSDLDSERIRILAEMIDLQCSAVELELKKIDLRTHLNKDKASITRVDGGDLNSRKEDLKRCRAAQESVAQFKGSLADLAKSPELNALGVVFAGAGPSSAAATIDPELAKRILDYPNTDWSRWSDLAKQAPGSRQAQQSTRGSDRRFFGSWQF